MNAGEKLAAALDRFRRREPLKAHWDDTQIIEELMRRLAVSIPDRVSVVGAEPDGTAIYKITTPAGKSSPPREEDIIESLMSLIPSPDDVARFNKIIDAVKPLAPQGKGGIMLFVLHESGMVSTLSTLKAGTAHTILEAALERQHICPDCQAREDQQHNS